MNTNHLTLYSGLAYPKVVRASVNQSFQMFSIRTSGITRYVTLKTYETYWIGVF